MPDYEVIDIEQHKHLMDTELGNYTKEDVACLVENMYFEARSDGYAGMYAVTMVVMNRVSIKGIQHSLWCSTSRSYTRVLENTWQRCCRQ